MNVTELIKILQEVDPNSVAMIETEKGVQEVELVQESADADYNEIYIMGWDGINERNIK